MRGVSLCSGYGGLDMAVEAALGDVEWVAFAEVDPDAAAVYSAHWPDVPNVGDLTAFDWTELGEVEVVTAGFPCQDISVAGKRAGIAEGTRSGLWFDIADALGVLRPRLVFLENVSAVVGRGLDAVLGDIARLGLDASWCCVRASDVGAPHRRERWFCVAADTGGERHGAWQDGRAVGFMDRDDAGPSRQRQRPRRVVGDRSATAAADTDGTGLVGFSGAPTGRDEIQPDEWCDADGRRDAPADAARDARRIGNGNSGPAADAQRCGRYGRSPEPEREPVRRAAAAGGGEADWGQYTVAIRRWEGVLGRPAPHPVDRRGRLSPRLPEWMLGLPDGWVCDHFDIDTAKGRNAALRILGNGVVPLQAATAYRHLLTLMEHQESGVAA